MIRKLSLTFLLFVVLAFLIAACNSNDTIAPVSSFAFPPDQIFYNGASSFPETPMVRFFGTAEDNVWVNTVQISFDDGSSWEDAIIEGQGARVSWYYEAMSSELSSTSTIQIRATDLNGNVERTGSGQPYTKTESSDTAVLENLINTAGTASTNDVIYLSSGAGGAYGNTGADGLALANTNPIFIVGNGFDQTITEGGISAITATSKTFLATSQSAPSLISAGADLYLRSLRIIGGEAGVLASDNGPLELTVDDCVIVGQEEWGVKVEDLNGGSDVLVTVTGSLVDASEANNITVRHGGILLDDVAFDVNNSVVMNYNTPSAVGSEAGLYIGGGAGEVSASLFSANRTAIWVHNSSPLIDSCVVVGDPVLTNAGVFFGGGSSGLLSNSLIDGNIGFGVKIEGGTAPTLYRNTISNNTEWGVIFEGNFPGPTLPNLGNTAMSEPGNGLNSFLSNSATSYVNANILVTSTSLGGTIIPAQGNWWGTANTSIVRSSIVDGTTWGGTVPTINYIPVNAVPP
jgi:parallel beta-helix repeat protein